jgi:hypothetical protein
MVEMAAARESLKQEILYSEVREKCILYTEGGLLLALLL